ncbi:MAG: hypothetical protein ACOX43_07250 [Bacilli bacterium]
MILKASTFTLAGAATGSFEIVDAELVSKYADAFDLEDTLTLDDEGSPFIKAFRIRRRPTVMLIWAMSTLRIPTNHKYMLITYKGEEGADLSGLRLEFSSGGAFWFSENAEGTLKTISGGLIPVVSTNLKTVIIDLEKSGINLNFRRLPYSL